MVFPVFGCLRRPRTHAGDNATLVDPQEPFGLAGLQGFDGQLARLGDEWMLPVLRHLQPVSHGRPGIRATLVGLLFRRTPAVAPTAGFVIPGRARIRHLPQAEGVDQGELREPEAGLLEHLQGLFSHVVSCLPQGVRMVGAGGWPHT